MYSKVKLTIAGLAISLLVISMTGCSDDEKGTSSPTDPSGYTNADGIVGGKLYDKFWATETGWNQSDANITTYYNSRADFFRCKQCHGWDLMGSEGAYISRAASASRPHVSSVDLRSIAASKTPQELFDAMKKSSGRRAITENLSTYDPTTNFTIGDQMPNYGSIFTDDQIWDIVRFMKLEAIDVSTLYDFQISGVYPTGSIAYSNIGKDGIAATGDAIYSARCVSCHGANGSTILVDGGSYTVGRHLRSKPNEDQHKIKFGQLGAPMGSLVTNKDEMKHLYKALTDQTKYPD